MVCGQNDQQNNFYCRLKARSVDCIKTQKGLNSCNGCSVLNKCYNCGRFETSFCNKCINRSQLDEIKPQTASKDNIDKLLDKI